MIAGLGTISHDKIALSHELLELTLVANLSDQFNSSLQNFLFSESTHTPRAASDGQLERQMIDFLRGGGSIQFVRLMTTPPTEQLSNARVSIFSLKYIENKVPHGKPPNLRIRF